MSRKDCSRVVSMLPFASVYAIFFSSPPRVFKSPYSSYTLRRPAVTI